MHTKTILASVILLTSISAPAGTTMPSLTSSEPVASDAPTWHWRANLYGWIQALDGDVTLSGREISVDAGFDDVLDNLDFAIMGTFEFGYGKWSVISDASYAELSSSSNILLRGRVHTELDQLIGNFAVSYTLVDTAARHFDAYAGVRVNSLDLDVDITTVLGTLSDSASETWVDPIIGARFQTDLSERFFFRGVGDIGGFGVSSDFTWQAMALLGYRINENGSVLLGYRGIGTDYSDGDFGYDLINHGVVLGFGYSF